MKPASTPVGKPSAAEDAVLLCISPHGVATLTLNRPQARNAYDRAMLQQLSTACIALEEQGGIRAVIIQAVGDAFCAGADLDWMRGSIQLPEADNLQDARCISAAFRHLQQISCPTIALVQGACRGGGVGLAACCDIVIATRTASFALTEVRFGLVPHVIAPYVVAAIGERAARRHFITAEAFDAAEAYRLGLVDEVVDDEDGLRARRHCLLGSILAGAPGAIARCKDAVAWSTRAPFDENMGDELARRAALERRSPEALEGLSAFMEKRPPTWVLAAE